MAAFMPFVGAFVCGLLAWRVIKPASQTEVAADEPYQWSDADMEPFKKLERQHALAAAPPPRHPSGAELVPDAAYQKVSKDPEEGLKKSELPVTRERK